MPIRSSDRRHPFYAPRRSAGSAESTRGSRARELLECRGVDQSRAEQGAEGVSQGMLVDPLTLGVDALDTGRRQGRDSFS